MRYKIPAKQLQDVWAKVRDEDNPMNWVLVEFDPKKKNRLVVTHHGAGGLPHFVDLIKPDMVVFGGFRVTGYEVFDEDQQTVYSRYISFCFTGPLVSGFKKAMAVSMKGQVLKYFKNCGMSKHWSVMMDLDENIMAETLALCFDASTFDFTNGIGVGKIGLDEDLAHLNVVNTTTTTNSSSTGTSYNYQYKASSKSMQAVSFSQYKNYTKQVMQPRTMKAVLFSQYKDQKDQDMSLASLAVPRCSEGMVLVKMRAAAINPIDLKVAAGYLKDAGWAQPKPYTPGYDLAGVVEEVGAGVKYFAKDDSVFAVNWALDRGQTSGQHDDGGPIAGAFAEYCLVPARKLSKMPEGMCYEVAAAVSLVGTTALQGVLLAEAGAGTKIMVLGGSGAVGFLAIQLAKAKGATVATTCSSRTMEYVKQAGPDLIIDYQKEKWEDMLADYDVVFDCIGEKDGFLKAKQVTKKNGAVFISIASPDAGFTAVDRFSPDAHAPAYKWASFYCLKNNPKMQGELMDMLMKAKLKIRVEKTFPFTKQGMEDIFATQSAGKSMGKNVIVFGDPNPAIPGWWPPPETSLEDLKKGLQTTVKWVIKNKKKPFFYKDKSGKVQGKFTAKQMQEWFDSGKIKGNLQVRRSRPKNGEAKWDTLKHFMMHGRYKPKEGEWETGNTDHQTGSSKGIWAHVKLKKTKKRSKKKVKRAQLDNVVLKRATTLLDHFGVSKKGLVLRPVKKALYKLASDPKSGVKRAEVDEILHHLQSMDIENHGKISVYEVRAALIPLMAEGVLSKTSMDIAGDMLAGAVVQTSQKGSEAVESALEHVKTLLKRMTDAPLHFAMPAVLTDLVNARDALESKSRTSAELQTSAISLAKHTVRTLKISMEEFMAHMHMEGAEVSAPAALIACATEAVEELEQIADSARPMLKRDNKVRQGLEDYEVDMTELNNKHGMALKTLRLCKKPVWTEAYKQHERHLTGAYDGGVEQGKKVRGIVFGDWLQLDEKIWLPILIDGIAVLKGGASGQHAQNDYLARVEAMKKNAEAHKNFSRVDIMSVKRPTRGPAGRRRRSPRRRGLIKKF